MARSKCGVVLGILLVGALPIVAGDDGGGWSYDGNLGFESADGRFEVDIVNRVQSRLTTTNPDIGEKGQAFNLNQYRLLLVGKALDRWHFVLQTDLAAGSLSDDETDSELLLDAYLQFKKSPLLQFRIGQSKVDFGRQLLIDSGQLQFTDRSIATERFAHGRDVGFAIVGENEANTYGYSVGLYNGNGINEATDENEDYLAAGRLYATPLGPMPLTETDPDWTRRPETRVSVGVAIRSNQMGEGSFEEERINTGGLEFAMRTRGFTLATEFFTESRTTLTGAADDETDTDGWYAQAGYTFPVSELGMLEFAGRYSEILRDIVDADVAEYGGVVNLYLSGHAAKIQLEYRKLDFEGEPFGANIDADVARAQVQLKF